MDDPDHELLERFAAHADQAAFTALVARLGPLVLGVCRRVLGNHHDAEDSAQAAFLILARNAGRLDQPIAPWLHRVALNLSRTAARNRRLRERHHRQAAPAMITTAPPAAAPAERFSDEIDAALAALPSGERHAITLYHLEHRPVEEVAQLIGRPVGTVCSWLARGRERLRRQLVRRGVAMPMALLLSALGGLNASEIPSGFAAATAAAATTFVASSGAATAAITLANQGIKTMGILHSIKAAVLAGSLVASLGAAGWIAAAESAGAGKKGSEVLGNPGFMPSAGHPVGWRGDDSGRYPGATPPTVWSRMRSGPGYEAKGMVWATPLPNIGVSSPIVVGQRIFLTSEFSDLVCLDKQSGRILWIRSNLEFEGLDAQERKANPAYAEKLAPLLPQLAKANDELAAALNAQQAAALSAPSGPPAALARKQEIEKQIQSQQLAIDKKLYDRYWGQAIYGFAGPTPASDGKRVCAFFATGISACYDLDGNRLWITRGKGEGTEHGNFASPVLCDGRLVVWAKGELRAYDLQTGAQAWRNTYTSNSNDSYGSLFRLQVGGETVAGFQAGWFARVSDGKAIWGDNLFGNGVNTPIVEGRTLYASVGYGGWIYDHPALQAAHQDGGLRGIEIPATIDGGKLKEKIAFTTEWAADEIPIDKDKKPFERQFNGSPLYVDGLIYRVTEGGGLIVNHAATGEIAYRRVLTALKPRTKYSDWGGASASPTLGGAYIYLMDNQGTTIVIQPGKEYKEVARNLIEEAKDGKEQVQNLANPVFDGARMYYRTPGYLYCIGDR